ncbi:IQ calmodulin-binding motif protein [Aspergillus clavatus NRRL 1]|uniref:IQ calmodulin-binding motif protein n=1 Tax=Aspergillus clavatus (strain ATCC 1007 / CBS 513.65 / DSM 816 / NCTC 3887 / NRRL 1 / QM 1276 / 107) TaxID=344612 RepID=A1CC73_ASPCL|nr:uncharacterized protein ACLA_060900 [Aspergillus clavatus NRRL 1]EAW12130.1 conserved hypothetical protein [Aspergillus clavatus NRRL 1]
MAVDPEVHSVESLCDPAADRENCTRNHDIIAEDRESAARLIQMVDYSDTENVSGISNPTRATRPGVERIDALGRAQALKDTKWHQLNRPTGPSTSPETDTAKRARLKWERVVKVAIQAGGDDGNGGEGTHSPSIMSGSQSVSPAPATRPPSQEVPAKGNFSSSISRFRRSLPIVHHELPPQKVAKMMDQRYFLEMVDLKHRHGSNLRKYHNYWKDCSSTQNFFYWLDYGDGKNLELPDCPRAKLEQQQVRYLTREERFNYLATIDEAGLFRWAKTNELVSTDGTRYKDSLHGIVPIEEDAPQFRGHSESGYPLAYASSSSSMSSLSSPLSEDSAEDSAKGLNHGYEDAKGVSKLAHVTPAVIRDRFARKPSKRKDMWIFVADTSFRVYIGIKEKGAFQHSSFLRGARIAAAGLIKIWNGQLRSVAPLSGHYRPPSANFRAFVHALQDQGVDMSHISITKSYAILAGMEGYTRTKHKFRTLHEAFDSSKRRLFHDRDEPTEAQVADEKAIHKDNSECSAPQDRHSAGSISHQAEQAQNLPSRMRNFHLSDSPVSASNTLTEDPVVVPPGGRTRVDTQSV